MEKKNPLQSKTIWVNLLLAVAAFFPSVQTYIAANPEMIPTAFAVLNIILRLVTKTGIQIG